MIGYDGLKRMISGGAASIRANHELLSKLDSATGDGDHGSAMLRSVDAVDKALKAAKGGDAKKLMGEIAWGVMGAAGGATGPLIGSLFLGFSDAAGAGELDCRGVAAMFESGLASIRKQTKAQVGDKTMMDALVPAVEALRQAAEAGSDIPAAIRQAADAAGRGAEATKQMKAAFGKARNLGDRTIGQQDPGATSVALLFRGFAEAVSTKG